MEQRLASAFGFVSGMRPALRLQGDEVDVRSNGHSVRARVAVRERMRPGAGFLIEGLAEQSANGD